MAPTRGFSKNTNKGFFLPKEAIERSDQENAVLLAQMKQLRNEIKKTQTLKIVSMSINSMNSGTTVKNFRVENRTPS